MGNNTEGQLGVGHKKEISNQPVVVKNLYEKFIMVRFS
jgi:hypothetical protein